MQQLWDAILKLIALVVVPDWGSLVGLIPLGVAAIVAVFFVWLAFRFSRAAPTRRGRRRIPPRPPEGVHEGAPSVAPLLVAGAAAIVMFGLVFHGPWLPAGITAVVLALLFWGREAMRDYDHVAGVESGALAVRREPPPGVHMPGPSFRPILVSLSVAVLFFGLVFGGAFMYAGILMLVVTLLGWLSDARTEYRATEHADVTGHLESSPAPGYPLATLAVFVVIVVAAALVNTGTIPPRESSAAAGGGSGGSAATAAAGGGGSSPAASSAPAASGSPAAGGGAGTGPTLALTAANISYDKSSLSAPANTSFKISFTNNDAGVPHNVSIHQGSSTGTEVWKGQIVTGPTSITYTVPALPAGTYSFVCSVHPNMTGTLTIQ